MMLDGIELHGRTNIVALGISTEGDELALGLWDGSTENATVAGALLSDLVDRGLDVEQGMLFVIDGSKALRKAIRQVFGNDVPVQRCVQHKQRNVLDHLPERDRDRSRRDSARHGRRPTTTWPRTARRRGDRARRRHPGAAASLREGMEETLTVTRLGITGKLKLTLQSTNAMRVDDLHRPVIHRNVKHWSSGEMCLRWTAAGMLEAETRFRKVPGYRGLAHIAVAIEHTSPADATQPTNSSPPASLCNHELGPLSPKVPRQLGNLDRGRSAFWLGVKPFLANTLTALACRWRRLRRRRRRSREGRGGEDPRRSPRSASDAAATRPLRASR